MGHIVRTTFEAVPDIEGLDLSYDSQFYAVEIIRLTAAAALVQDHTMESRFVEAR
jgi:hypothetical protein